MGSLPRHEDDRRSAGDVRQSPDTVAAAPPVRRARVAVLSAMLVVLPLAAVAVAGPPEPPGLPTAQRNMTWLGRVAVPGAMSITFSPRKPLAYVHGRKQTSHEHSGGAITVLDISDPGAPRWVSEIAVPSDLYMEDSDLGVRADGTEFVLARRGTAGSPRSGLQVVDVTNPEKPVLRGLAAVNAHTWTCVDTECRYAYGSASGTVGQFNGPFAIPVVDLADLGSPSVVDPRVTVLGGAHDWNRDRAGVLWGAGRDGLAAYDVTKPLEPRLLNTSDRNGPWAATNEYNDKFHLHGSLRPNARRFLPGDEAPEPISVHHGNVLLVSEEGPNADCTDSFQTWHVPALDGATAGTQDLAGGTITPLDSWTLLSADPTTGAIPNPQLCAAHWFDYHPDGFVTMAAYGAGTRVLDVRNARDIEEHGYHWVSGDQASQSYWVPQRAASGRATGRATTIVYTADAGAPPLTPRHADVGGVDIFEVTLP